MKILTLQIPHTEKGSGGKVITQRNERLLKKYFGSENVFSSPELGLNYNYHVLNYETKIRAAIKQYDIDIVFLDNSLLGLFSRSFYRNNIVFCFFHNVEAFYRAQEKVVSLKGRLFTHLILCAEKHNVKCSYKCIAINERDSEKLKEIYGRGADYILPSSMEDKLEKGSPMLSKDKDPYLLFVGTDFYGNTDGLFPFIEQTMPHVKCRLIVAGTGMEKYAGKYGPKYKTQFLGYVEDLAGLYQNALAVVLPIISGSGMKTKTCEALMYGKKLFGTQEAFEGFIGLDQNDCILCRNNSEFTEKINEFLNMQCSVWSEHNRQTFLQYYSDTSVEKGFSCFMEESLNRLLRSGFVSPGDEQFRLLQKKRTTDAPLVSVIMPVYNTKKYLKSAVQSVLRQTLQNLELILIDDESTDGSINLELEFAQKDERISVYAQNHAGQGFARNSAIRVAEGKYIYFLDSDDSIVPHALQLLTDTAEEKKTDFIYFSGTGINKIKGEYPDTLSGREMYVMTKKQGDYEVSPSLCFLSTSFCREKQLLFDEGVYHEDELFVFSMFMQAERAAVLNNILFQRTARPYSTTTSKTSVSHIAGVLRFYEYLKRYAERDDLLPTERKLITEEQRYMLHDGQKNIRMLSKLEKKYLTPQLETDTVAEIETGPAGRYYITKFINSLVIYGPGMTLKKIFKRFKGCIEG